LSTLKQGNPYLSLVLVDLFSGLKQLKIHFRLDDFEKALDQRELLRTLSKESKVLVAQDFASLTLLSALGLLLWFTAAGLTRVGGCRSCIFKLQFIPGYSPFMRKWKERKGVLGLVEINASFLQNNT